MLSRIQTAALWGLEAFAVECEVDVGPGLPGFILVGLPDASAREARDRIWPALRNAGLKVPDRRVTVNLAPAAQRKEGASADLAIAIGVLCAMGQTPALRLADPDALPEPELALDGVAARSSPVPGSGARAPAPEERDTPLEPDARAAPVPVRVGAIGEVALDGSLRGVRGTLSLAEALRGAGATAVLCAADAAPEAALIDGLTVHAVRHIGDVVDWLRGSTLARQAPAPPDPIPATSTDLSDVRGQAVARRALEIAAAGGHHALLVGPPGAGKSMLARRVPGILPPLTSEEAVVVTRLHSVAGLRPPGSGLARVRPFRAPHHSLSRAGLVGGGSPPRPGELSLAHRGVLFLDELSEYPRGLLDALREPLETGSVWIARARASVRFPARPMLIGAMNPCFCGWLGHPKRGCRCTPTQLAQLHARVSGPVLDRLDLQIEMPALSSAELQRAEPGESSATVRERVCAAREVQRRRGHLNAGLPDRALRRAVRLDAHAEALVAEAMDRSGLSARGVMRALRVARTIADLERRERVSADAVAEALMYRSYEGRRGAAGS